MVQILCNLKDVPMFIGVYTSDVLNTALSVSRSATLIVNTGPHNAKGTQWIATDLNPRSYSGYFLDSYRLPSLVPNIIAFLRRMCTVWEYNVTLLQRLTSRVCGKYCCLFVLYMDRGYTAKQLVALFDCAIADRQVNSLFASEFEPLCNNIAGSVLHLRLYKVTIQALMPQSCHVCRLPR